MRKRISLAVLMSLLLLTGIFLGEAVAQPPLFEKKLSKKPKTKHVPGEIIVKFKPGIRNEVIRALNQRHGCSVLSISRSADFKRLRIPKGKTVDDMVRIYSKNPNVDYAEPNSIAYAFLVPTDEYYVYQWNMDDTLEGENPYGGDNGGGINVEPAWDISTGGGVVVAVIDTGVAYENYRNFVLAPDLANTSFVAGYDFVNNDTHPNDDEGHGTHVTGTIAQSTDNGIGVVGVAFNCSIMPVKVLDGTGSGTYVDIADGIYFAADNGADVINMSLGGPSTSITLEDALGYAHNKGVVIVCAAGNEYEEGNPLSYPAAYDAYCIAVGATRYDETRAYYSNTGDYLDLTAPGGDLTVNQNGDSYNDGVLQQTFGSNPKDFGYWFYQGTSMAAPHVAGVAALLMANGTTDPDGVREALESTAEDQGAAGWDSEYGWGIVDAYAALNYTPEPVHDVAVTAIDAPLEATTEDIVSIDVSMDNQGTFAETTTLTLTDTIDNVEIGSLTVTLAAGELKIVSFNWDAANSSIGGHILEAKASAVDGETDTADNSASSTVTIVEAPTMTMHVSSIDTDLSTRTAGPNEFTNAIATVTVVDSSGNPVDGATVYGSWSSATTDIDSGATDSSGKVTLASDAVKNPPTGTNFIFTISDVVKSGWTYDSATNIETSDSITIP
ncbi:MAG: S8 family serine peptidase [Pseudomonadota bacterium]